MRSNQVTKLKVAAGSVAVVAVATVLFTTAWGWYANQQRLQSARSLQTLGAVLGIRWDLNQFDRHRARTPILIPESGVSNPRSEFWGIGPDFITAVKFERLRLTECQRIIDDVRLLNPQRLMFVQTRVSGDCLCEMASISSVTHLLLLENGFQDEQIARLAAAKQLQYLFLSERAISPAFVHDLRLRLPNCRIVWIEADPAVTSQ